MQPATAIVIASLAFGASVTADTLRWTNPAGGSFFEPGNWEGNRVPGPLDVIVFDLPVVYTVTLAQSTPALVGRAEVVAGTVTFQGPGLFQINQNSPGGRLGIGDGATPAELKLIGADIHMANPPINIGANATFTVGAGASVFNIGDLTVPTGAKLLAPGGSVSPLVLRLQGGQGIVSEGGLLNGDVVLMSPGTEVTATGAGSRFTCESEMQMNGRVTIADGAKLTPLSGLLPLFTAVDCDIVLEEGGIAELPGFRLLAGLVQVQDGASWNSKGPFDEYAGLFEVLAGATATLQGTFLQAPRVDQAAVVTQGLFVSLPQGLIATIDGLVHTAYPVVRRSGDPMAESHIGGPLTLQIRNSNGLRFDDMIPIFEHQFVGNDKFTALIAPDIGAGRELAMYRIGMPGTTRVFVFQGPPSCYRTADFDGDSDVGTDADIQAFFACLAGTCCKTCGTADFNGDGVSGADADIEAFFIVLAGGNC